MGGDNSKSNLVLLTAREHFIAHWLLIRIYPDNYKLAFAFFAMCNQVTGDVKRDYKISSRTYDEAKLAFQRSNSSLHSNKKLNKNHIEIIRARMLSDENPMRGRTGTNHPLYKKPRSIETKLKISSTKTNHPERNASYKGEYVTPIGIFKTAKEPADILGVSADVIRSRCKTNSSTIITKKLVKTSIGLDDSMVGYTYEQLGWSFIPKSQSPK
jgi:hypothetical protein